MNKENPEISPEEITEVTTLTEKEHEIILYNDEVNTFDHVIECLITICDHTSLQAEQCAYLVHFSGKCGVKTGTFKFLTPRCSALLEAGLSAEIV
jgi:ATP-dependent Clp protease adaptor protein ClpS